MTVFSNTQVDRNKFIFEKDKINFWTSFLIQFITVKLTQCQSMSETKAEFFEAHLSKLLELPSGHFLLKVNSGNIRTLV